MSDDNEYARYLASYLVQNSEQFIKNGILNREMLEKVIKEFMNNLK